MVQVALLAERLEDSFQNTKKTSLGDFCSPVIRDKGDPQNMRGTRIEWGVCGGMTLSGHIVLKQEGGTPHARPSWSSVIHYHKIVFSIWYIIIRTREPI